jgi:hypothetical protein
MLDRAGRTLLAKHKVLRVKLTGAYVVGSDTHVLITREFELRLARA